MCFPIDYRSQPRGVVVILNTLREMLHKWVIDVQLQTPRCGIKDTPAHR
jgi:hypothetical protein